MSDCIPWKEGSKWYGKVTRNGRRIGTHRAAWEDANGPIPDGMEVLHRCDNPPCINVDHLFIGTHRDNMKDMAAKGRAQGQQKTACHQGHEYTEQNTYRGSNGNKRQCRACQREAVRRYNEKKVTVK